ncbi:Receptor-type guanylate cyclase gcy [Seminavis robusta]|uniref:Receptor-type guanylate cyclase gcy n=1 Tax=Seminavis robusta TaxID=568900 RepID=A0A9N8D592_9STRA|nr:Receptor-type guanylate cyclase gcy [Seminavis robusta]|eukprot:Sro7_g006220.1 Receptor-type guanylate cyclase gcy (1007) ;mRNA; r:195074-199987
MYHSVTPQTMDQWTNYSTDNYQEMIQRAHWIQKGNLDRLNNDTSYYKPYISRKTKEGYFHDIEREQYWPSWQFSPPQYTYGITNWNVYSVPPVGSSIDAMLQLQYETTFSEVMPYRSIDLVMTKQEHAALHSRVTDSAPDHPHVLVQHPVHRDPTDYDSDIVALFSCGLALDVSLLNLLPEGVEGIHCVIKNNVNQTFTYVINGQEAIFLGEGDQHETDFSDMEMEVDLALHTNPKWETTKGVVSYSMHLYPSATFKSSYDSNTPEFFATIVAITFVVVAVVFFVYDVAVFNRNENLVVKAAQSIAIVSAVFPDNIRDRLMGQQDDQNSLNRSSKGNLKAFLNNGTGMSGDCNQKPLADLFLDTTVMFADISGFTAWSSVREPSQVFLLLETLYQSFDRIAKRRRVFKVETVGDCYVAVCGLPEPREDHAVAMARCSRDILARMNILTRELETTLGPETGDLALRVGIHSGPVTAGVLRGDRARFQLFGDTMNVCSRLESTSRRGRIHCSWETAQHIIDAGKEKWLEKRQDLTEIKGKGFIESYFVNVDAERAVSVASRTSLEVIQNNVRSSGAAKIWKPVVGLDGRTNRLIDWNVQQLLQLLKPVVASRCSRTKKSVSKRPLASGFLELRSRPLDEVKEIIRLPEWSQASTQQDPSEVEIPPDVVLQLHLLVGEIAKMYNKNPFHNFDHASHVVLSVTKLMSRIVAPSDLEDIESHCEAAAQLHDHTYGITSSPLTLFSCAFSALIHDVDHVGVSNVQLVKEGVSIAAKYKNRSVAEQNSLDLSWDLLMEPRFEILRSFLFPKQEDMVHFRQLVVNSVMATDIVDKELKELRHARWEKAFNTGDAAGAISGKQPQEHQRDAVNRKATIVIEHIIQASDISHTMQHWHVYRKWNQKLFEELYLAYLNGRMEKDPSEFWFQGEFGFFDYYIIPLTRKLKECGVFGVSSDEYLNYALKNRAEWELKGEAAVKEMLQECREKYGEKGNLKLQRGLLLPGSQHDTNLIDV